MRLIDADALLKHSARVVEYDEAGFSMEYNAIPTEVIKNAPTVEAKHDWIPTSERLPEQSDEYIVQIYGDIEPTTLTFYPDPANWMDEDGHYYKVIAWMPLPKPYQEGE